MDQDAKEPFYFSECAPISSIENIQNVINNPPTWAKTIPVLNHRNSTVVQNIISDCHVPENEFVSKVRLDKNLIPKTLVCHDYKGGYVEDRYLKPINQGACYTFYNWAHIDIFVYFSHHLVTIPPSCWTKTAHQNGVKILGTFITEFGPGTKICEEIFKTHESANKIISQLTKLSEIFKFDGWLLNIENPLKDTTVLQQFVENLTLSMHRSNPESVIIWYDSVLESGELKWQNELNVKNRCFFDRCDGIFLNYCWKEDNIKTSLEHAKHRNLDVYVGIDVFARNTAHKAGFDVFRAAQLIRRYNLSMAIFAPGWTHETLPKVSENDSSFLERFIDRDLAFWNVLWPYLYTHPITRPFFTTFYNGTDHDVFDLFSQEIQLSKIKHPKSLACVPNIADIFPLGNKCNCIQYELINKYTACMLTKTSLDPNKTFVHRLFTCNISLNGEVIMFYHRKIVDADVKINIALLTCLESGSFKKIILHGVRQNLSKNDKATIHVNPSDDLDLLTDISKKYYHLTHVNSNWLISVFQFNVDQCKLLEIGAILEDGNSICLCSFGFHSFQR